MSSRRPRVKVAANLSIRRAPKAGGGEQRKTEPEVDKIIPCQSDTIPVNATDASEEIPVNSSVAVETAPKVEAVLQKPEKQDEQPHFKLPKPVDDVPKQQNCATADIEPPSFVSHNSSTTTAHINYNNNEEPMSPRKQEARLGFPLGALSRKRNRTESLTSNKSLPEGIMVNKVTRKVATKQEESQRTQENKKEARKRLTNIDNVNKQNLTMFDMIYYNPISNPMETPALSKRSSLENIPKSLADGRKSRSVSKSRSPTPAPGPPLAAPRAPAQLTPQLKLGPNGEMILDEASLVIENEREKEMRETLANNEIVYQDEFSGNSGYYSRIRRTRDWTNEETVRFYRCLHTIGTDFSMMLTLFPCRTRRDLKLKFKKEERLNLQLVNKALQHPKEFNLDELKQQFAQEDEELERIREEQQLRAEETQEKLRQEKLSKKLMLGIAKGRNPKKRVTKSERVMLDGTEDAGAESQPCAVNRRPKPKGQRRKKIDHVNREGEENGVPMDDGANGFIPITRDDPPDASMIGVDECGAVAPILATATSEPILQPTVACPGSEEKQPKSIVSTGKRRSATGKLKKPQRKLQSAEAEPEPEIDTNTCDVIPSEIAEPAPYIPNGFPGEALPSIMCPATIEAIDADDGLVKPRGRLCVDGEPGNEIALTKVMPPVLQIPVDTVPSQASVAVVQTKPVIAMLGPSQPNPAPSIFNAQPCLIDELTPVVIKYDGTDLEYLPLPGANAPVARKVRPDEDMACTPDNSRASLLELKALPPPLPAAAPAAAPVVAAAAAVNKRRPVAGKLSTGTGDDIGGSQAPQSASENPQPGAPEEMTNIAISDESISAVQHKRESGEMEQPINVTILKTAIDDNDEYEAGNIGASDECFVADELIPGKEDNDYSCTKEEEPDVTKDGYLCERVAEITIGKEQLSAAAPFGDLPKKEIAGHQGTAVDVTTRYGAEPSDTAKTERKREQIDQMEQEMGSTVGVDYTGGGRTAENEDDDDDDDDGDGAAGFSLQDIDINSLVLVESQDASEPNRTIYEIYVADPVTGQLSEKPLDVPEHVIGNIRAILEAGDGAS